MSKTEKREVGRSSPSLPPTYLYMYISSQHITAGGSRYETDMAKVGMVDTFLWGYCCLFYLSGDYVWEMSQLIQCSNLPGSKLSQTAHILSQERQEFSKTCKQTLSPC